MSDAGASSTLGQLTLFRRGKVRDTYDLGDHLLMVASDRISAFDVVLPNPIPGKGIILTQFSRYWFERTRHLAPNHLISTDVADFPQAVQSLGGQIAGRTMLVQKADRIDIECVVRGYLAGSAWTEYRATGALAGERMPPGLRLADRLPEPIFTPAIKNDCGHDENISRVTLAETVGSELALRLEEMSRRLYAFAAGVAEQRGIILADTKFEFGFVTGELTVIDEMVTPDSSRFWDAAAYAPGYEQPSFDKQFVRDWLIRSGWNKQPPAPSLPPEVVAGTAARYAEAFRRLTGESLVFDETRN